ncbi:unnamed protein product [Candidula unifasciata]|uniref:LRRNT domain-containing protein n=1 Tax=Candidula unifasciata TaxID=100452 RepID=A0A8S3ZJ18_9EUPU|nr:unnamed protein product [Candidula unifasciata]
MFPCVMMMFHLMFASGVDYQCPYGECECFRARIMCDNLGMEELPPLLTTQPTVNTYLSADNNAISHIRAGTIPAGLVEISLVNNPIVSIDDTAFALSSTTLEIISITNARFTRIPDAFRNLTALKYFTLSGLQIQDWNSDVMKVIGATIEMMSLGPVGLTSWPSWFQFFTSLTEVTISGNAIASIPEDAFDQIYNRLTSFGIINSSLTELPKALSKLSVLETLIVQVSDLSELAWLPSFGKLTTLRLEDAHLSSAGNLSNALKVVADSVDFVGLQGNRLTTIPELSFMTTLSAVDFMHNRISDTLSGSFPPGVETVDLSYNLLPAIPRPIYNLKSLAYLTIPWNYVTGLTGTEIPTSTTQADFGHNLISELTDSSFPENSSIIYLTLSYNPIVKISSSAFQNLLHLGSLLMTNTNINRLPVSLAPLKTLYYFDISGSQNLVCTCEEVSLRPLFLRLESMKGNCGQIDIYYFYTSLSVACPT